MNLLNTQITVVLHQESTNNRDWDITKDVYNNLQGHLHVRKTNIFGKRYWSEVYQKWTRNPNRATTYFSYLEIPEQFNSIII